MSRPDPTVSSGPEDVTLGAGARRGGRTGRRPGEPPTRAAILAAARDAFGEGGYDHATIRDIAARAGVDPALVLHYYGSKEQLFEAALDLPVRPATFVAQNLARDPERVGEMAVRQFLHIWENAENRPVIMAMLRSVVSNEYAADLVRRLLVKEIFAPLATQLGLPDAELRADLVGSQFIGLALMRYVGRLEPLASTEADRLVAAVAPTVQRYLTGDIGGEAEDQGVGDADGEDERMGDADGEADRRRG